jgi:hypothetical protein
MTKRAEHGAGNGADAAGKRGAADDGCRDGHRVRRASPCALVAALRRAVEMAAAMAQSTPISMKIFTVTQRVLMPASSAASGLPPMAKT